MFFFTHMTPKKPGGAGGGMQLFFPANVTGRPWEADIWGIFIPPKLIDSFGNRVVSKVSETPIS